MPRSKMIDLGVDLVYIRFNRSAPRGWYFAPEECWIDECEPMDAGTSFKTREEAIGAAIKWARKALAEEQRILRVFVDKFKTHNR